MNKEQFAKQQERDKEQLSPIFEQAITGDVPYFVLIARKDPEKGGCHIDITNNNFEPHETIQILEGASKEVIKKTILSILKGAVAGEDIEQNKAEA